MTSSTTASNLGSDFDDFLFAPIGEDGNGMRISVLSALARHDVDPWDEAAELALLPREIGTQRLALLIATLPEAPSPHRDAGVIAVRLMALLPSSARPYVASDEMVFGVRAVTSDRPIKYMIFIVFMLVAQWFMTGDQHEAKVNDSLASASSMAPRPEVPPDCGQ
jgi:hypothetical protein